MSLAEAIAQESIQDRDALVMRRSGKARLAFDIDQPGLAQRDGCGDARGTPEGVAADIDHGESIYAVRPRFRRDSTISVPLAISSVYFSPHIVEPQHPLAQRPFDVRRTDAFRALG